MCPDVCSDVPRKENTQADKEMMGVVQGAAEAVYPLAQLTSGGVFTTVIRKSERGPRVFALVCVVGPVTQQVIDAVRKIIAKNDLTTTEVRP